MGTIRLAPIEKPGSLFLKLAYNMAKRQFGKVIMPLKVIYARVPALLMLSGKMESTEKKLSLPKDIRILIKIFISHSNDCKFCSDFSEYEAAKNSVEGRKIIEMLHYRKSAAFSDLEKALFAYLEEINATKSCSDETFNNLKNYFSEKEIIEITWLCAKENYYNMMAKPLNIPSDQLAKPAMQREEIGLPNTALQQAS
ncbi:MAG: carboxymuconolactone decarboxylase family protein [Flavisolibacter sp.]|nr:carboxymuconolactone decarboxylase family protein [Flavisolibacter sp.]